MARIICRLANASTLINGWTFARLEGEGMVSEDLADEVALNFCQIPGFAMYDEPEGGAEDDGSDADKPKKRGRPAKADSSAPSGGDAPV